MYSLTLFKYQELAPSNEITDNIFMKTEEQIIFSNLQKRLKRNKKLSNYNYRGERTFVVVSGSNSDKFNLSKVKGLNFFEERMLFILLLLKYKNTKIIYVTSENFDVSLFDYYLGLISNKPKEIAEMKSRLAHIEVKQGQYLSLTERIYNSQGALNKIARAITNYKTTVLRCYNPTVIERKLAVKIGIPLFGSAEKFDYVGSKSGGRKVFKLADLNVIPGITNLKNFTELYGAIAKMMRDYPKFKRLVIKLEQSASGRGNCLFSVENFLEDNDVEISVRTDLTKLSALIKKNFQKYCRLEADDLEMERYIREFNRIGGIVEGYIDGKIKYSPSTQLFLSTEGSVSIVSTHEQILGGRDGQKYLGCTFPALDAHRKLIIKEAKKVGDWMVKKGMVGHFSIDFVTVKSVESEIPKIFPIEINLRKGGTTHPFRIAYYLTKSKYNKRDGILYCGKTPIYYMARDVIESEKYKVFSSAELIKTVDKSKISFNKNTKKGVLIYMPGMISEYGRFGALAVGHTKEEAESYFKRMIKAVDLRATRKINKNT